MSEKETKRDRFVRVAEARTNKILHQIRLIGNLSNRCVYEYTNEDMEKIFAALEEEIAAQKERFQQEGKKKAFSFADDEEKRDFDEKADDGRGRQAKIP